VTVVAQVSFTATVLLMALNSAVAGPRSSAPAVYQPELIFDISDDTMLTPLGVIIDVAVHDSVVFLLDQQSCDIRRISFTGQTLSPIGQRGEGPGDLSRPERMAVTPDGRCLILQTFSHRATCITSGGRACDMVDISPIKEGYKSSLFVRAEAGQGGWLLLSTVTSLRAPKDANATFAEMGTSASVKRVRTTDGKVETLFATETANAPESAVIIPLARYTFMVHGWDVSDAGVVAYADPAGAYRMTIGHPLDTSPRVVDLPEAEGDDRRVRDLAKALKVPDDGGIPRVASIQWLDDEYLLVRPAAELHPEPAVNSAGTFEVFDRAGSSYGRYDVHCEFDPDNDQAYVRGDILIVIRGAQSVARTVYRDVLTREQVEQSKRSTEVDEIRIRAYRLFRSLRATAR
jgi:hypothetical protein